MSSFLCGRQTKQNTGAFYKQLGNVIFILVKLHNHHDLFIIRLKTDFCSGVKVVVLNLGTIPIYCACTMHYQICANIILDFSILYSDNNLYCFIT